MKIGIVTGGGDCPGLNAVIRAVAKTATKLGWETLGIIGGYEGLLPPQNFRLLDYKALDGLLVRGGTILGTANRGRFSAKTGHGETRQLPKQLLDDTKAGLAQLGIEALVAVGGDGSLTIAHQMHEYGIPIVGVPKTIDNDLAATTMTFGFDSAVACATDALDRLHTTAESHNRVLVLEVMGRYAGWIALNTGTAGSADAILIPEIPCDLSKVAAHIKQRAERGRKFSIVVVAEGAKPIGGDVSVMEREVGRAERLGGIGERVAQELEALTGQDTRVVVLGHLLRGGSPTTFDRLLSLRFGAAAVRALVEGQSNIMVALDPPMVRYVPLEQATRRMKTVPPDCDTILTARELGISFGD